MRTLFTLPAAARGLLLAGAAALCAPLPGQVLPPAGPAPTANSLATEALAEMEAGRWEAALALLTRCVETHDTPAARPDPSFGVTWYRKGMCELRLRRWDDAATSFETCYSRFPNLPRTDGPGNLYHKRALLRWGEARQAAGKPEEALRLYEKFLTEREHERDDFEPAPFYLNLAICRFRLGRLADGVESFETALANKQRYGTPDSGVAAAFQDLVAAAIRSRDESILRDFLRRNRAAIVIQPFEMEPFAAVYLELATDALAAGMDAAALELAGLVPAAEVMIADLQARLEQLGPRPSLKEHGRTLKREALQASLDELQRLRRAGEPPDVARLGLIAVVHEKQGNLRGARAAWREVAELFPESSKHEDARYQQIRLTAALGENPAEIARRFLEDFPKTRRTAEVRRLLVGTLFRLGDHAAAAAAAEQALTAVPEGSPDHDLALHVLAASRYHLGDPAAAQPLLSRHLALYPESPDRRASRFYQASAAARLAPQAGDEAAWREAAAGLERFLTEDPGPYAGMALLDLATCRRTLREPAAAIEALDRLGRDHPDSPVLDAALALQASLLDEAGRADDATVALRRAADAAEALGHSELAADSLLRLVSRLGDTPEAVAAADRFWKSHTGSPLAARMAVAQLRALEAAGRGEEAMERLKTVLLSPEDSPAIAAAAETYATAYAARQGWPQLEKHLLGELPPAESATARSRRLLGLIAAAEARPGDETAAALPKLYQRAKRDFTPAELPPSLLVRLGDHLRRHTSAPRQALPYYEQALSRADAEDYRNAARFGRADVLCTGSPEEQKQAAEDFRVLSGEADDPGLRALSLLRLAACELDAGYPGPAAEAARRYLAIQPPPPSPARATWILACASERLGHPADALAGYREIWKHQAEEIDLAAPAMLAWLRLSREGGVAPAELHEAALDFLTRSAAAAALPETSAETRATLEAIRLKLAELQPAAAK